MTPPTTGVITTGTAEADLVARAAAGDGAAFETLMRRHNQLLFRIARSILGNDADAEEAVQDAYLRAWRALGSYRAQSRLSTWLVRIVTNEALGRLRRARPQAIPLETAMTQPEPSTLEALTAAPEQGPDRSLLRAEARALMEAGIDRLPDSYRTVFVLRAVEEMSVEDVAAALDIPPATVRTRFFRARSLMRAHLGADMDASLTGAFAFDGARCDRIVASVLARARAERLWTQGEVPGLPG
jgi:RNA polymerase sigma-70 factor (ECF subfamily)